MNNWRKYLYRDNDKLLSECKRAISRGSGPGGQKRNKTSNAVQLIHIPTGLSVRASEERSQKTNKNNALERLRMQIALNQRSSFDGSDFGKFSTKNPITIAIILDALDASGYVIAAAANLLGLSTAKLSKLICSQSSLLEEVNKSRSLHHLRPIRTS